MALKIIHIFNHDKFVDQYIANIKPGNFENTFIFLKNENTYSASSQIVKHVVPYSKDYYEIIEECVLYDIIILYDLDKEKINIVNRLQYNNATIIWVFYGADLYSLPELKERLFSDETVNLLDLNIARNISYYFKRIIRPIYQYFKGNKSSIVARRQAIAKIDFFALYGREEYDYLNNKLKNKLPQFIEYLVAATFTSIPY
ncbi:MAG: hypothetical protein J0I84_20075, partial [Terrimonas sp.]|nr:hypothetical protein [Terrimonas sp.]